MTGDVTSDGVARTLLARLSSTRADPLARNSLLLVVTTVVMAATGSIFWVIASRLADPAAVGVAGAMATAAEGLAFLSLLGLNNTAVSFLSRSRNPRGDALLSMLAVAGAAAVLTTAYVLVLPHASPRIAEAFGAWWHGALFVIFVVAAAVNQMTDSLFIAVDRAVDYLGINGGLIGCLKVLLPWVLASVGAFWIYGALGIAVLVGAAASVGAIVRHTRGRRSRRFSEEYRAAFGFSAAGYVTNCLFLLPQFVLPVVVVNRLGASEAAVYMVSFQVATVLNAMLYSIGYAMHAEAVRSASPEEIVRRSGMLMAGLSALGCVCLQVLAPVVLLIFGDAYADGGTSVLRLMALGSLAVAFNFWGVIKLRLSERGTVMVGVQLASTVSLLGLAWPLAASGVEGIAWAWCIGHLVGGVLGFLASRTVAPLARPTSVPAA